MTHDKLTDEKIEEMTLRFLTYPLPLDFNPDGGIQYHPHPHGRPVGTNLLNYTQARAMVEYMLGVGRDN